MEHKTLINSIIDAVNDARQQKIGRKELKQQSPANGRHEFLFFIKPELTFLAGQNRLEPVLKMILQKFDTFHLEIGSVIMLASSYLERHHIIAQHYGVINALARNAKAHLTGKSQEIFSEKFKAGFDESTIYGGLEMLEKYPALSPLSLDYLWQNSPTVKLGSGAYCQALRIDGKPVYLVNGFHPRQLEHYTAPGKSIVAFTLTGNLDWSEARNRFIGKTNPLEAEPGSIRRTLLDKRMEYGLQFVNSSWNGVHLSAGPVEGLVELIRYNSDFDSKNIVQPSDLKFGKELLAEFDIFTVKNIMENTTVAYKGIYDSIFNLTEEKNGQEAIQILKEIFNSK